ncbi:MAG: UDP-3-O-(3-hydroxymyristoyl)glucosamine N-acyltransferase [Methylomicrobium sp.]|nr:UDP-3-O-(3-hydroxymyristoyl)glucosamine N-acyltransferase [Methylomicrobium sp.]
MTLILEELAKHCDAEIVGGDKHCSITSAADIKSAAAGQITILNDPKYAQYLSSSRASACFIKRETLHENPPEQMALLVCKDPEISFIKAIHLLYPSLEFPKQISDRACIADSAMIAHDVYIAPFVSVGEGCLIGEGCEILNGAYIGNDVILGVNCRVYPNAVIYDHSRIGNNVVIHAGAVIGADGFGYKQRNEQQIKVPHVGNIIIEDDVEIGANTCIDRGTLGSTVIGSGSKIDNLVQIGHNNTIGNNVIICGQTGISGSCTIEDNAILAGSAGIADHVKIGHHAVVMARSGVSNDIAPATQVFGSPAKDRKVAWKELAALTKVPGLLKKIKDIEIRLGKLEQ